MPRGRSGILPMAVESPPYFCAASETGRDVAVQYAETPVGTLQDHKFVHHAMGNDNVQAQEMT